MTALTARILPQDDQTALLDDAERWALSTLRFIGARCRGMARGDLFKACAMLSDDRTRAVEAVGTALLRGLNGEHGMPKLRLYQLNSTDISFDESWLLSAISAARRGDETSLTFLLARRIPAHARRQIGFLVVALADALDQRKAA